MRQFSPKRTLLSVTLVSLGIAVAPLGAQAAGTAENTAGMPKATGTQMAPSSSQISSSDKKFIEKAAQGGVAEVEMGKLAQQKAENDQVKQFGERMVKDHSKAGDKLTQIAELKGVTPPADMDAASKREYDKLAKLSGAQFDREYMKAMVSDHVKDIKEFKEQAKSGKDADIRDFAESTTPTLEEHLKLARSAESAAKGEKTASK
jgi:putative membrane protein